MSDLRLQKHLKKADVVISDALISVPVIVSDSKGNYLKPHAQHDSQIVWHNKAGRTTDQCKLWINGNVNKLLQENGKIHIYIWVGTCDFTYKPGTFIHLKENQKKIVENLENNVKELRNRILAERNAEVTFCHIPYYSIKRWNENKGHPNSDTFNSKDLILKDSIDKSNAIIDSINSEIGTESPKFNQDLIKSRSRRGHTRYSTNFNLLRDGIHPTENLAKVWLSNVEKRIKRDCRLPSTEPN